MALIDKLTKLRKRKRTSSFQIVDGILILRKFVSDNCGDFIIQKSCVQIPCIFTTLVILAVRTALIIRHASAILRAGTAVC